MNELRTHLDRLYWSTVSTGKLSPAEAKATPTSISVGFHFQTFHRRYLFRADLCVLQMIPSVLNSPDLIKAKNKLFHSATSASNQYLMPIFPLSPLELKQIGSWTPDTAWQTAESNIWLLDTTQLISLHSLGEIGHPMALTQTWTLLLTQIKPSLSTRQVLHKQITNACSCPQCSCLSASEGKLQSLIFYRTELYGCNEAPCGCKITALVSEQSSSSPAAKRRLILQHRLHVLKYHPELSLFKFAGNWHRETTMNEPFLPVLHIFMLRLMLFVLNLRLTLRRGVEGGGQAAYRVPCSSADGRSGCSLVHPHWLHQKRRSTNALIVIKGARDEVAGRFLWAANITFDESSGCVFFSSAPAQSLSHICVVCIHETRRFLFAITN